jgi:protein-disulfide isomerase
MKKSILHAIGVAAAAALLTFALAGCIPTGAPAGGSAGSSDRSSASSSAKIPTGTAGAVDFDLGAIVAGDGKTVVDTYIDPMCPYCGQFEKANGSALAKLVNTGAITLRVHPLNFLDPNSQGTDYSSRAGSALTCVAASDPKQSLAYLSALYANQPEENSSGLSDSKLVSLAHKAGVTDVDSCIHSHKYASWLTRNTTKAVNGPIKGADIKAVTATPTVLVNGHQYGGSITDTAALKSFIADSGK